MDNIENNQQQQTLDKLKRLNRSGVAGVQFGNVPSFVITDPSIHISWTDEFWRASPRSKPNRWLATNPVLTAEQRAKVRKFNGVFVDGTIYIREGTDRPNLAVLGHEFGHY
ncbi:MAG: hypothetical protein IPQ12_09115 [Polaromonas sp.]|nr:hypothetical protein [Polaromonas sp.]